MLNNYDVVTNSGQEIRLSEYAGKVILVVNTASRCGFVRQYEALEALYQKYRERGFVVLGFPSNDFFNQEPGTDEDIQRFCESTYSVSFPLFRKNSVRGKNKQPLFKFLTEECPLYRGEIWWNFEKFLIGRDGVLKARYRSWTTPSHKNVVKKIEELLSECEN